MIPDWTPAFLGVADQLLDVAFADGRLVLVVHDDARLKRSAAGITVSRPYLFLEADLLQFSPSSRLGHFAFEFLVPLAKLPDFS